MNRTEESVFTEALAINDPQERATFLEQACAGDADLRASVESLLKAFVAGSFLEKPAFPPAADPGAASSSEVTVGDTLGEAEDGSGDDDLSLDFLARSDASGSLGRLAHYEIQEVIGHGGMGIVLRAVDEKLRRVVAIKVMAPRLATNASARRRFSREAQSAAAVCHDHVVTIHAVDEAEGLPYLVMQYVAGVSLQTRIERTGPLRLHEILRIGTQIAAGLAAAHAQGLIHRDIKPANILLENGVERVKITDFGLARAAADASLTQSGVVAGTPHYMSPEQARGEALDHRADLFSLGSVLYAMCTGRPPFRANNSMAVLKRVCEETPAPIREINADIPDALLAVIDKLHNKSASERFASAAEVSRVLGEQLAQLQQPGTWPPLDTAKTGLAVPAVTPVKGTGLGGRRRWTVPVSALFCLIAALIFAEAAGVTDFRVALTDLFAPGGTHEPQVMPRPKQPESAGGGAVAAAGNPFVILGSTADQNAEYATLAEAVANSKHGDVIEVRGDGPFVSGPLNLEPHALTIRAGPGFRPVLRLRPGTPGDDYLLRATAALVLEGLEIRETDERRTQPALVGRSVICSQGDALHLANCRVLREGPAAEAVSLIMAKANLGLRNCECHLFSAHLAGCGNEAPLRISMDNCIAWGDGGAMYLHHVDPTNPAKLTLRRNTLALSWLGVLGFSVAPEPKARFEIEASANLLDLRRSTLFCEQLNSYRADAPWQGVKEATAALLSAARWSEQGNVYRRGVCSVDWWTVGGDRRLVGAGVSNGPPTLMEWNAFWGLGATGSVEGQIRFRGGDQFINDGAAAQKMTPADFQLRADSAGHRAAADGADLGADVDLVGPGPAYERWRKTPDYQQWCKDTRQLK
jgi:hypothetical protein